MSEDLLTTCRRNPQWAAKQIEEAHQNYVRIEHLSTKLRNLEQELERAQTRVQEVEAERDKRREAYIMLESAVRAVLAERDAWKRRVQELEDDAGRVEERRQFNARIKELEQENAKLRDALRGLLLSADAAWSARHEGHDWSEALERARQAVAGKPY